MPTTYTTDSTPRRFQCRHIFTDGHRCGSPSLHSPDGAPEPFCFYHGASRPPKLTPRKARSRRNFTLPRLEDRSAVQHAIGEVLDRLAAQDIDPRRAGLLLYGLQIASLNLPRSRPATDPADISSTVEEVTIDPTHGPLAPPAEVPLKTSEQLGSASALLLRFEREGHLSLRPKEEPAQSREHVQSQPHHYDDHSSALHTAPGTLPRVQAASCCSRSAHNVHHGRVTQRCSATQRLSGSGAPMTAPAPTPAHSAPNTGAQRQSPCFLLPPRSIRV